MGRAEWQLNCNLGWKAGLTNVGGAMHLSTDQYQALSSILLGLAVIIWAPRIQRGKDEQRRARLSEIEGGASEQYFEERRQLQAYGAKSAGPFQLLGALLIIIGLARLLVR